MLEGWNAPENGVEIVFDDAGLVPSTGGLEDRFLFFSRHQREDVRIRLEFQQQLHNLPIVTPTHVKVAVDGGDEERGESIRVALVEDAFRVSGTVNVSILPRSRLTPWVRTEAST